MEVATIEAARDAFLSKADGETCAVRYFKVGDRHNDHVALVRINHRWFPTNTWRRNDATGLWDKTAFPEPLPPPPPPAAAIGFLLNQSANANSVIPSLCKVGFNVLHAIDGVAGFTFSGAGLVIDAELGLVVCDRNTVVGAMRSTLYYLPTTGDNRAAAA